jgi:hypothetical protein
MADSKPWRFTQTGGARKVLSLEGQSAPHGRPRASPVVEDEIALRDTAVYYPGNPRPTRHLFGEIHTDWTLTGRFSDAFLGPGGARAKAHEVKAFLAEEQQVRIEWGDILAATGLLRKFKPGRESEAEIAWTLTVGIDSDDSLTTVRAPGAPSPPGASLGALAQKLGAFDVTLTRPRDLGIKTDFFDQLDGLVSMLGGLTAGVVSVAHSIDDFEQAAAGELNRLRAAIRQLHTATLELHATLESAENDFAFDTTPATSEAAWHSARAEAVANAFAVSALLADADRELDVLAGGQIQTTHAVSSGDSWESLSSRYYGGPGHADRLRKANGARYGEKPTPGRVLQIPIA